MTRVLIGRGHLDPGEHRGKRVCRQGEKASLISTRESVLGHTLPPGLQEEPALLTPRPSASRQGEGGEGPP